jgi:large subunit ribosomal protein L3
MTHVLAKGFNKQQDNTNVRSQVPVTILEAPPMRIAAIRGYITDDESLRVHTELPLPTTSAYKRHAPAVSDDNAADEDTVDDLDAEQFEEIRLQVYTQPNKTKLKQTPSVFELTLGGSPDEQLEFIKDHINQPFSLTDVFNEGDYADITGITKGKGLQGPVKRFGIGLKGHKSQKGRRRPGSLGPWIATQHIMPRVPKSGQDGYHQRTQHNNLIMRISDDTNEINVPGGYKHYGDVNSTYLFVKGSVPGPAKRLITLTHPETPKQKPGYSADQITYTSTTSHQG